MNKHYKKTLFRILVLVATFWSSFANASTLGLENNVKTASVNSFFTTKVVLDTEGKSINTIEGDFVFDNKNLEFQKVLIGGSFISFWIEKPAVTKDGFIHFSGIVPGGVSVNNAEVFSVVFKALNTGSYDVAFNNVHLFINDSQGTEDKSITLKTSVIVEKNSQNVSVSEKIDKTKPEPFEIIRFRNSSLFDNAYAIAFSTQDKGTGIDHYSVCELFRSCVVSESPYMLQQQSPFYYIAVKAYDANGNYIKSSIVSPLFYVLIFVFLFVVVILSLYFYKKIIYTQKH
ncbi:MAG: hypothetical protein ACR2IQ_01905 [Minisyncoccia bacterium]